MSDVFEEISRLCVRFRYVSRCWGVVCSCVEIFFGSFCRVVKLCKANGKIC